jgi:hypothetical protein
MVIIIHFGYILLYASGMDQGFLSAVSEVSFNRISGRFYRESTVGYQDLAPGVNDLTDKTSGTPFIEIGTCSPFQAIPSKKRAASN